MTDTRQTIENMKALAVLALPSAKETTDNPLLAAMGCIPDTVEWALMKLSFLDPDDLDGIIEWQEYFIEKGKEKAQKLVIA